MPAFARQMGVSCNTCHFQHFPELNSFGRAFKASGFTMTGTSTIDQDGVFSLPSNLNAAIFTNLRYQKSNGGPINSGSTGHGTNDGAWIFPGETSLFVGGRVSPHVGALVEGDVKAGGDPFLASIKVPLVHKVGSTEITGDINGGIVPFSAGLGPAYAFEILNTGAVGNHFMNLVNEASMSAMWYMQAVNAVTTDAEGIGAFLHSSDFFVTVAQYDPNHLTIDSMGSSSLTSHYVRVAITPQLGRWDTGFGFQWYGGQSNLVDTLANGGGTYKTHMWGVDGQLQGNLTNGLVLGVYASYSQAPSSSSTGAMNLYNLGTKTKKAGSVSAELGFFNDRATVQLGYRWAEDGFASYNIDNAYTVGLTYLPWDNVQFGLWQSFYSGSAHSGHNPRGNALADAGTSVGGTGHELTSLNLAVGF